MKLIFFPNGWVLAHASRMAEVAKIVRSWGHEVVFAGEHEDPRSYLHICREAGFRTTHCMEFRWPYIWDRFMKYRGVLTPWDLLTHRRFAPLDRILDDQVQLIMREKPDAVVCDGTISVSTAAYITKTPAAGIMNAYYAHFYSPTSIFRPAIDIWDWVHLSRQRKHVFKKYGCKPAGGMALLKTVQLISPGIEELDDHARKYPNWESVGPIWGKPACDRPDWLDTLDDGRTNVYITMGSTGNLDKFLRRSYQALAQTPYRFIVTTGKLVSKETRAVAPDNFLFADYAPGDEILEHCRALIYHGGNGSMYQALAAGVPMIAIPHTMEQSLNVRLGIKYGFTMKLKLRHANGEKVVEALKEILGKPSYAEAARRFSKLVREASGAERAAEIILDVARDGIPPGVAEPVYSRESCANQQVATYEG